MAAAAVDTPLIDDVPALAALEAVAFAKAMVVRTNGDILKLDSQAMKVEPDGRLSEMYIMCQM